MFITFSSLMRKPLGYTGSATPFLFFFSALSLPTIGVVEQFVRDERHPRMDSSRAPSKA